MADEFDQLRQKSMRTSSMYDDIEGYSEPSGGLLSRFTPIQRLILGVLVLLDVLVIGFVVLSITGVI